MSGEFGTNIGACRIASTSAEPISAIVRSSSRSKPEVLRTIAEMGAVLVDAIRHAPMVPCNSPDMENSVEKLLCAHFASFPQEFLREAPSGVARVAGGSP